MREKSDLSHEVHADNCTVTGAFCDPSPPAYSYRSVSALLYLSSLHDQFEGGRFFFADRHPGGRAFTPTTFVEPRCGRLLAFTSGPENLHGVMPVAAGTRFIADFSQCVPFTQYIHVTKCIETILEQLRCALGLWFSHDANYWEPEIGLAWDLVCNCHLLKSC